MLCGTAQNADLLFDRHDGSPRRINTQKRSRYSVDCGRRRSKLPVRIKQLEYASLLIVMQEISITFTLSSG